MCGVVWCVAMRLFDECGFLQGEVLARGSLTEVLKFDVEAFVTTLPKRFGLPPIDGNCSEGSSSALSRPHQPHTRPLLVRTGIVVRPWDGPRLLLKKKSANFAEVTGSKKRAEKIRAAAESGTDSKLDKLAYNAVTEAVQALLPDLQRYGRYTHALPNSLRLVSLFCFMIVCVVRAVTENRLRGVLSKVGPGGGEVTRAMLKKLTGA
jgi:hypothetical protein